MTALHRKLLRDLVRMKEQAAAIGLVMACGIATFIMSLSMIESLTGALDTYYDRARFAHVFAQVRRAPLSLEERLRAIPGVGAVECRVVEGALLELDGEGPPASARIISLPRHAHDGLNRVHLRAGRLPEGRDRREVLVSQRFATAHQLAPGDTINAILNGRRETLRITGIALSPEFIYLIPPGGLLPEYERYAVLWMGRDELEAASDMEGAFNDVLVRLMPHGDPRDVIVRLDRLLERYGGGGAYLRADQPSHQFVANEISELRGMTLIVPTIFLAVAAFLLHLVLGRLIATQREQIAALRALGYTATEIARHYLGFALLISLGASLLGIALGAWMGRGLAALYADFFDFPHFDYLLTARVIALGLLTGPVAGALAVAGALRSVMRLAPAEAMRPPTPLSYRATILERLGVHALLPVALRMVVRHMERRPLKTAMSIMGVSLATSILVVGAYTEDATEYLLDFQFNRVLQRDVDLVMNAETDAAAMSSVRAMEGVLEAEAYRSVGVRLRHGHRTRRTGILGLQRDDGMHRLLGMDGRAVSLPPEGIVLSSTLAGALQLEVGDHVRVEVLEGRRPVFDAPVAGLLDDFSGLATYMRLDELNAMMSEEGTIGGVFVRVDDAHMPGFWHDVRQTPRIMAANVTDASEQSFRDTIAKNLGLMRSFLIGFSMIIAFGVVYNGARVSLSERGRDLATLRVLGFTKREVAAMQLGELAIITAIAVPTGLLVGLGLAWLTAVATRSELFRMPFIIHTSTFALAIVVIVVATFLSGAAVRRRVHRLDLMAVLKSRE